MAKEHQIKLVRETLEKLRERLLDKTSRNKLLNFNVATKGNIRVIDELPDQLVDLLLSEASLSFRAVPLPSRDQLIEEGYIRVDPETGEEIPLKDDPSAEEWARVIGLNPSYELPMETSPELEKHQDSVIQTLFFPPDLEARLKKLTQQASLAIQETGANILYIAFGFLEWHDEPVNKESANKKRLAPLFLIPIRLEKRVNKGAGLYEYSMTYSGEDIITNISLREKLREDFSIKLPEVDETLTPEAYFKEVSRVIKTKDKWKVHRYATLALLNFSKLLMYLDLDPTNWPEEGGILSHPLLARFLTGISNDSEGSEEVFDLGFGEEYEIDTLAEIHQKYPLIYDADSSQHSAIIDALDGKNLVIEGPPGTGKSQTITNLIAALIANGKTVLFVAEKLAALEVVKRRLDSAGLGDFCLELHSHKSQKRKVLEEIGTRLAGQGSYREPRQLEETIEICEQQKAVLKKHVEIVNSEWKQTGKTAHEILMGAARFRESAIGDARDFHPVGLSGRSLTPSVRRSTIQLVEDFKNVYLAVLERLPDHVDGITRHPWFGVTNIDLQWLDHEDIEAALRGWQESLKVAQESGFEVLGLAELSREKDGESVSDLKRLSQDLNSLPTLTGNENLEALQKISEGVLRETEEHLDLYLAIKKRRDGFLTDYDEALIDDLSRVDDWSAELTKFDGGELATKSIDEIRRLVSTLDEVSVYFQDGSEALHHFSDKLPDDAGLHLEENLTGFENLVAVIRAAESLDASLWRLRDNLFDREELDACLLSLVEEVQELRRLKDEVSAHYRFESVPDYAEISSQLSTLRNAGAFKIFTIVYRRARSAVRSYSIDPKQKAPDILKTLPKLAAFVKGQDSLMADEKYSQALGAYFNGIDTNLEEVVALRDWYKSVRKEFGTGLGGRVSLGNAIIRMPEDLARTARGLVDAPLVAELATYSEKLKKLGEIFPSVQTISNSASELVSETAGLARIVDELRARLSSIEDLTFDKGRKLSFYNESVKELVDYKNLRKDWMSSDFDARIFDGTLDLRIEDSANESPGVAVLKSTLSLARVLHEMATKGLSDFIKSNPSALLIQQLKDKGDSFERNLLEEEGLRVKFTTSVSLNLDKWCGVTFLDSRIDRLLERNRSALSEIDALSNWMEYLRIGEEMRQSGLGGIVAKLEVGELDIEQAVDAHQAGIFDLLAREVFSEEPALSRFSGKRHETIRDKFRQYDKDLKKLQRQYVASRSARVSIPSGTYGARVSEHTEKHLLEHEIQKKTKHIPIRQLMNRAGAAISAIKPCFMMGPMSVSQYLQPGRFEFDVLVMDEASQIKPQDALAAIARAKQLIVVGDPKQLPPTSFFDRINEDDSPEISSIEETESILDATMPIFAKRRLRWHYRSQHESLIEFSNHQFYDSDLVIFPSPHADSREYGIKHQFVPDGTFVNRKNSSEARLIAEAVRRHIIDHSDESLGVVAMNTEQRDHIEAAIDSLAREDSLFREQLDEDAHRLESLFIKNLENVQGDERDVMLISMTYGPQERGGRVPQRFGPINSDVGWRRLNVLFTRSKKRMHVFSSMRADDIVIGPQSKRGVAALRNFLSYCETGILAPSADYSGREPDSDFEIQVMEALARYGFECRPQVGVAGFFIDLGVIDPNRPGRFLMGIECDGATYHSAKSTRDRDRLRQEILERLGWKIRRIWSTDWFNNAEAELQPIINELRELMVDPRDDVIEEAGPELAEPESVPIESSIQTDSQVRGIIEEEIDIREGLSWLSDQIKLECPNTPPEKRLLRTAMMEAIIKYEPTDRAEFLQRVPGYLREATSPEEGWYLDQVFEIVNGSLAVEELLMPVEEVSDDVSTHEPKIDKTQTTVTRLEPQEVTESPSNAGKPEQTPSRLDKVLEVAKTLDQSGEPMEKISAQIALRQLREEIWTETGTEPDKFGILKRDLLRRYLDKPFSSIAEWEALVGKEAERIHQSHKPYLPRIIEIVSRVYQA